MALVENGEGEDGIEGGKGRLFWGGVLTLIWPW